MTRRKIILATLVAALTAGGFGTAASAADKVICLLPSLLSRPAFAPWVVAKERGYFAKEGIDIEFQVVGGGAEVAKQVGVGNAIFGDAIGDTPIIVRSHGVPVKSVALLGGGGLTQLIVREGSPIKKPADLKGRRVSVLSYQDTTYYALLGALANAGLTKSDVTILAGGPANIWTLMLNGKVDAIAGVPDYAGLVSAAGVKVRIIPINHYFRTMASAAMASDAMIKKRPELIRRLVHALLQGMKEVLDDPQTAVADFIKGTPENAGKEQQIALVMGYYDKYVFGGQKTLGAMNGKALAKLQDFYFSQGIIDKKTPVDELYTNEFIK